jgi:hypothetical protein
MRVRHMKLTWHTLCGIEQNHSQPVVQSVLNYRQPAPLSPPRNMRWQIRRLLSLIHVSKNESAA